MINVGKVVDAVPRYEKFWSVEQLHALAGQLRTKPKFQVKVAGVSAGEVPIFHVKYGSGSTKALIVGGPHAMEPIGSLTVSSLLTLMLENNRELVDANVEWHIVPCIDPNGALLNEGWSQKPFTLESYVRNYYLQAPTDEVDLTFPLEHKRLTWNRPSTEASILRSLIDEIQPDFYFPLHNAWTGGAFFHITRDIDQKYYQEIHQLLEDYNLPLQRRPIWRERCPQYAQSIIGMPTIKGYYDYLERTTPSPEKLLKFGGHSWEYLAEIKPDALSFVAEIGYVRHPSDESERATGQNLRRFKLRIDAESRYLATVLLEEWQKVRDDLDPASPFYRAICGGSVFPLDAEAICAGGMPLSRHPVRDVLFNPMFDEPMTEGDRFNACMVDGGFLFLLASYQFVRFLKASVQTPAVHRAVQRLDAAFDDALSEIKKYVDFSACRAIDCTALAKVQLGSGLIVLNSILERRNSSQCLR